MPLLSPLIPSSTTTNRHLPSHPRALPLRIRGIVLALGEAVARAAVVGDGGAVGRRAGVVEAAVGQDGELDVRPARVAEGEALEVVVDVRVFVVAGVTGGREWMASI